MSCILTDKMMKTAHGLRELASEVETAVERLEQSFFENLTPKPDVWKLAYLAHDIAWAIAWAADDWPQMHEVSVDAILRRPKSCPGKIAIRIIVDHIKMLDAREIEDDWTPEEEDRFTRALVKEWLAANDDFWTEASHFPKEEDKAE